VLVVQHGQDQLAQHLGAVQPGGGLPHDEVGQPLLGEELAEPARLGDTVGVEREPVAGSGCMSQTMGANRALAVPS
jgi:hypothetical protein